MSNMTVFNFENNKVRVHLKNNEPWFCLIDICKILDIKNTSDVKKRLNESYLAKSEVATPYGNKEALFIAEPNLYELVFCSNKPEAAKFKKWVFEEVLPQIRKTGSYGQQQLTLEKPKEYPRRITMWESEGLTDMAQGFALKYFGHTSEKAHDAILMRLKYEADANDLADMNQEQFDNAFRFLLKLQPEAKKLGDYCQMQEEDFIKRNVKGLALV